MDKLIELAKVIWRNPKVTLPILFVVFPSLAGNLWFLSNTSEPVHKIELPKVERLAKPIPAPITKTVKIIQTVDDSRIETICRKLIVEHEHSNFH